MPDDAPPTVAVTGAGRGIGLAIARRLAPTSRLILHGRDEARLRRAAAQLPTPFGPPRIRVADLADEGDRTRLAEDLARLEVDVLVNNAGVAPAAPIERTTDADWNRAVAVNLTSVFVLTRAVLPGMRSRGFGRVIQIASTASLKGYRNTSAYAATKAGVVGLVRALAVELAGTKVTINAVCPTFTDTDMVEDAVRAVARRTGKSPSQARKAFERFSPLGRLLAPDEVAGVVAFLASKEAAAISGQALAVDGGETAG